MVQKLLEGDLPKSKPELRKLRGRLEQRLAQLREERPERVAELAERFVDKYSGRHAKMIKKAFGKNWVEDRYRTLRSQMLDDVEDVVETLTPEMRDEMEASGVDEENFYAVAGIKEVFAKNGVTISYEYAEDVRVAIEEFKDARRALRRELKRVLKPKHGAGKAARAQAMWFEHHLHSIARSAYDDGKGVNGRKFLTGFMAREGEKTSWAVDWFPGWSETERNEKDVVDWAKANGVDIEDGKLRKATMRYYTEFRDLLSTVKGRIDLAKERSMDYDAVAKKALMKGFYAAVKEARSESLPISLTLANFMYSQTLLPGDVKSIRKKVKSGFDYELGEVLEADREMDQIRRRMAAIDRRLE